nr:DNA-binding response regulator [arsenite-oxidising bacterium NT-25]
MQDNEILLLAMQQALESEGFTITHVGDGRTLTERLERSLPDLLILDAHAPGTNGIDLCRSLRLTPATSKLPVLMIVSEGATHDRIASLSAGADDCMMKPISPIELAIRARNILRRLNPRLLHHVLAVGDLTLDRDTRRVHRREQEVRLGPKEFRLLEFLMESPGKVWTRPALKACIWGEHANVDERTVDLHVTRLRKSISLGKPDKLIRTVRGKGYSLEENSKSRR